MQKNKCPICRYDIRNYHSASYNNAFPPASSNLSRPITTDVSTNLIDTVTDSFLNEFITSNLSIPTGAYGNDASSNQFVYTYINNT